MLPKSRLTLNTTESCTNFQTMACNRTTLRLELPLIIVVYLCIFKLEYTFWQLLKLKRTSEHCNLFRRQIAVVKLQS